MVRGNRSQAAAALAVVALSIAALSGCSTSGVAASEGSTLTLAATKSPVQLLRNEAASRIPPAVIEAVSDTEDFSIRCKTEAEDPIGLRRSWHSNAQVTVKQGSIWRVDAVVDEIAASFVEQGWVATPLEARATSHAVKITKEGVTTAIRLSAQRPAPGAAPMPSDSDPVTIDLELNGPCVDTDGPESDEVTKLEAQD
jgi:hypothetical protein